MEKKSTSQKIADEIEQLIAMGHIKPGERLDETSLAKKFKVSRTPIREALKHLASRDILVSHGGRGLFLAELQPTDIAQMFETMAELEFLCARLAAHRISWLQRAELERIQEHCLAAAEKEDRRAFLDYNEQFHALIYQSTQNQYISRIASEFRRKSAPFRSTRIKTKQELLNAALAHTKILDLLKRPKSEENFQELREHINDSSRKFIETSLT